jgi:hypothetical protein
VCERKLKKGMSEEEPSFIELERGGWERTEMVYFIFKYIAY